MNKNWLVVNTKTNSEKKAFENLRRQNFNVFFPKIKKNLIFTQKQKIIIKPLFPGYLFVEYNNEYNWLKINSTYGVSKIVQFGKKPIYVPTEFLKDLKKRCDKDDICNNQVFLHKGDKIKISKENGSPIDAIFDEFIDLKRSFVLIKFLNREFRTSVQNNIIEKIN
jgi:transcriptional antiterminator RfaH